VYSVSWNLRPFKANFISGKSQKSFWAKSGNRGLFHFINRFWAREHLVSWSIDMVENLIVGPKFRYFSMHSFT
jgi:hypothetical protein